jgi:hypothetical protein
MTLSNNREVSGKSVFQKQKFETINESAHLRTQHRGPMSVNILLYQSMQDHQLSAATANCYQRLLSSYKYRRCRVCRKPDWCGYTTDEQTSICMRISNGSKGTSRNGGNIFHHNRLFLVASPRLARKPAPPPIEIAPIEIRNAVTRN